MAGRDRGGDRGREARRAAGSLDPGRWGALAPGVRDLAERPPPSAAPASSPPRPRPGGRDLAVPGAYAAANFAVATAAARGRLGRWTPSASARSRRASSCPGGCRSSPATPAGPRRRPQPRRGRGARRGAARGAAGRRSSPAWRCSADKDAAGILGALAPQARARRVHRVPAGRLRRAGRPGARAARGRRAGRFAAAPACGRGGRAAAAASGARWPRPRARSGAALVSGSHYLLALDAWTERHAPSSST